MVCDLVPILESPAPLIGQSVSTPVARRRPLTPTGNRKFLLCSIFVFVHSGSLLTIILPLVSGRLPMRIAGFHYSKRINVDVLSSEHQRIIPGGKRRLGTY